MFTFETDILKLLFYNIFILNFIIQIEILITTVHNLINSTTIHFLPNIHAILQFYITLLRSELYLNIWNDVTVRYKNRALWWVDQPPLIQNYINLLSMTIFVREYVVMKNKVFKYFAPLPHLVMKTKLITKCLDKAEIKAGKNEWLKYLVTICTTFISIWRTVVIIFLNWKMTVKKEVKCV